MQLFILWTSRVPKIPHLATLLAQSDDLISQLTCAGTYKWKRGIIRSLIVPEQPGKPLFLYTRDRTCIPSSIGTPSGPSCCEPPYRAEHWYIATCMASKKTPRSNPRVEPFLFISVAGHFFWFSFGCCKQPVRIVVPWQEEFLYSLFYMMSCFSPLSLLSPPESSSNPLEDCDSFHSDAVNSFTVGF